MNTHEEEVLNQEEFLRSLAAALHNLHDRPDDNGKWVTSVTKALKANEGVAGDVHWGRLGLARELARLSGLSDVDTAALTIGLFLQGILDEGIVPDRKTPHNWTNYLRRNHVWLAPALHIGRLVHDFEPANTPTEAVAAVTAAYDRKTRVDLVRPIIALTELRDVEMTEAEERTVDLLWSEAGQAICDRHFRVEERQYSIGPDHIRDAMVVLQSRPRPAEAPMATVEPDLPHPTPRPADERITVPDAVAESESFKARKAHLRRPAGRVPANVTSIHEHRESRAATTSDDSSLEERPMENPLTNANPPAPPDSGAAVEQLDQLTECLAQIHTLSGQALTLLQVLEPNMHRNASIAAELSSIVRRFEDDLQRVSDAA